MKDVNDLMQAILEMDAAQRRESEKARLERSARLAALDEHRDPEKRQRQGQADGTAADHAFRFLSTRRYVYL